MPKNRPLRRTLAATVVATATGGLLIGVAFAAPAFAATSNPTPSAGARQGATRLPFSISGATSLSVDVGTGNALIVDQLLTLPGVRNDVPISLSYNSSVFGSAVPSAVTGSNGSGWAISGFDQRMVTNSDSSVTYYGDEGLSGVFTANGTAFTSPPQFQATLSGTKTAGYTLIDHASQEKLTFNAAGRLTSDKDRDGNTTSYGYDASGNPSMITSSRGPAAGRSVAVTTSGGEITKLTQTLPNAGRTVSLNYSSNNHLASVVDAAGATTSFASAAGTDTGQVVTITSPVGSSTTLGFTGSKISQVAQTNPVSDHGAGTSTTRLTYPTTSQTLVADPTTDQTQAVSAVAHSTYNLTTGGTNLVASATDPDGHQRSATYTTLGDIASSTPASGGTTTATYGSNTGESLTKVTSPGGAAASAAYGNAGGSAYLPSSTTDDASNILKQTYDSNGNEVGSQQGASGPTAKVTYNSNGTAATSASPGAAAGVVTTYNYDSNADLSGIVPPSGNSLGNRSYTWDGYGRLSSATDGNGSVINYAYDNADRITGIGYSDSTGSVAYSYDADGHDVSQRSDGSGVSSYTYDDLGHLTSAYNSANGATITYTYDLAGALASSTDALGTTSYSYDAAHELTAMTYPQGSSTATAVFANDANGKRTDVWLQSNATHTTWSAHEHYAYDTSGRISAVKGENGPASSPVAVVNQTLCYSAGAAAPACPTTASADRSNIQWTRDSVSGETNTYTYTAARLTKDVVTGGANPRTYTYGYDSAGNRTSATVTGTNPSSQTLTYNNANQITNSGYTYDAAGNLTTSPARSATFNAAGQQTSATVNDAITTYGYAGTNQDELLTEGVGNGNRYSYTYGRPDANGLPTIDSTTVTGSVNTTGYVLSDPSGQPVMLATNDGASYLYLYDATGSPVALSSNSQSTAVALRYDPYGATTRTDTNGNAYLNNPFGFGQGTQDRATGEVKFGQRFYSPTTGNWTQQDTLNAPLDPSNANRYEYAADNPLNDTDPTGRSFLDAALAVTGAVVSGAAVVAGIAGPDEVALGIAAVGAAVDSFGAACAVTDDENGCTGPGE